MSVARNLLLTGGPPGGHDFEASAAAIATALALDGVHSEVARDPGLVADRLTHPTDRPDLVTVSALRWTMKATRYAEDREMWAYSPDDATRAALGSFVAEGGGLLALHTACVCFDDWDGWAELLGAAWDWDHSFHDPVGPAVVEPTDVDHPINHGVGPFTVDDEIYQRLSFRSPIEPLLTSTCDGRPEPVVWARSHGRGRVVVDTLGHDAASWNEPNHHVVLRRSAAWARQLPDHDVRRIGAA